MSVLKNQLGGEFLAYSLPALVSSLVALIVFIVLGHTPLVRALGLAATISGVALTLRRFGVTLAIAGGLALAFCPAFWSQTSGLESPRLTLIVLALAVAFVITTASVWVGKIPIYGLGMGIIVFALIFWLSVGPPRSLRITTFMNSWLIYLLIDALLIANPRPEDSPPADLQGYHVWGILLLLTLALLNDPISILLAPASLLTLASSPTRPPRWYWVLFFIVIVIGLRNFVGQYLDSDWWLYPAAQARSNNFYVPYVMADGWRETSRWLNLFNLVIAQFTPFGVILGVLGLVRLARWYPSIGQITMLAYAPYTLFGLVYFGRDAIVLLFPLMMIQILWMTYAVYSFGQWLQKNLKKPQAVGWLAPAVFTLLPLLMLIRILMA